MQVHDRAVVHGQYSTECVGHVSFFCFCSFLCVVYVCDYGVDLGPYGQLWGPISFFLFSGFHFCLCLPRETWQGCWARSPGVTI